MPRIPKPIDERTASKLDGILGVATAEQVTPEVAALLEVAGTPVRKVPKSRVNLMSEDADLGDDLGKNRPEEFI